MREAHNNARRNYENAKKFWCKIDAQGMQPKSLEQDQPVGEARSPKFIAVHSETLRVALESAEFPSLLVLLASVPLASALLACAQVL